MRKGHSVEPSLALGHNLMLRHHHALFELGDDGAHLGYVATLVGCVPISMIDYKGSIDLNHHASTIDEQTGTGHVACTIAREE